MLDASKTIITFDYQGPQISEISRNLSTLYGTVAGSIPLDREFGLNIDSVSYPPDVAKNMIAIEIIEKTEIYEPRVEVKEVTFTYTDDGNMIPNILLTKSLTYTEEGDE